MKFFYYLPGRWVPLNTELVTGSAYRRLVQTAERVGFYGACLDEHPAPVASWLHGGGGHHSLDPMVTLAMFAGATTRLRLLTYLAILPARNPFLFAKAATSLDVMSEGRLILGVGTGYMPGEFAALGVDFEKRNELFSEAIEIFRKACSGEAVTYSGVGFCAEEVIIQPVPVQKPHPPLWLGGNAKLTLRRVAEFGQGWLPMLRRQGTGSLHKTPFLEGYEDLKEMMAYMFEHANKVGRRAPIDVVISGAMLGAGSLDEQAGNIEKFRALGVTGFVVSGERASIEEEEEFLEIYADRVIQHAAE